MKQNQIKRLVLAALLTALTCVCTMVIQIPIPATGGYLNLGDSMVLLCAWYIGGVYGVAAAGIGSMLADIFSGYAYFAPGTLAVKALMALAAWLIFRKIGSHKGQYLGALAAACIMVGGYLFYESVCLGYGPGAIGSVPANLVQGFTGALCGVCLSHIMEKNVFLRSMLHPEKS
jgi:uncharacterized membrane protein